MVRLLLSCFLLVALSAANTVPAAEVSSNPHSDLGKSFRFSRSWGGHDAVLMYTSFKVEIASVSKREMPTRVYLIPRLPPVVNGLLGAARSASQQNGFWWNLLMRLVGTRRDDCSEYQNANASDRKLARQRGCEAHLAK